MNSPQQQYARQSAIDDTEEWEHFVASEPNTPTQQVAPERQLVPESRDIFSDSMSMVEDEESEFYSSLSAVLRDRPTASGARTLYDPDAKRDTSKLPCFRIFKGQDCPGKCGYSHDEDVMYKAREAKANDLLSSPFVPANWLAQYANSYANRQRSPAQHQRSGRNASLQRVVDSSSTPAASSAAGFFGLLGDDDSDAEEPQTSAANTKAAPASQRSPGSN
jgi:hypothetical protein